MLRKTIKKIYVIFNKHDREPEIFVISYPKSGRTWHRLLVGSYLAKKNNVDIRDALHTEKLTQKLHLPVLGYRHNGADFLDPWPAHDDRVADPALWQGKRVIFLVRDLKDVLASSYFHAKYRSKTFEGEIGAFIRDPRTGAEKILTAWNRWHATRKLAQASIVQTYEAMHANAAGCLAQALDFAGYGPVDADVVAQSVHFCQSDNMRSMEKENFFKTATLRNKAASANSAKVRAARIGDHVNHLDAADIAYVDALEQRLGNPFAKRLASADLD